MTQQEEERIVRMYKSGYHTVTSICGSTGHGPGKIKEIFKKYNVPMRDNKREWNRRGL